MRRPEDREHGEFEPSWSGCVWRNAGIRARNNDFEGTPLVQLLKTSQNLKNLTSLVHFPLGQASPGKWSWPSPTLPVPKVVY